MPGFGPLPVLRRPVSAECAVRPVLPGDIESGAVDSRRDLMSPKQELLVPEAPTTAVAVPDLQNRLIDLASDKDFNPETLRALIEMKERSEDRSAREQFNAAFASM